MRVYIPVTLAMLAQLVADRSMHAVNSTAFAVTPTLREAYAEGDDEELAEVALRNAADVADFGDEDAELTVGDAQDHDLAWYAPQELPFLLDLL